VTFDAIVSAYQQRLLADPGELRAHRGAVAVATSTPSTRMRPAVGSTSRRSARSSVVLPSPLGPTMARDSPFGSRGRGPSALPCRRGSRAAFDPDRLPERRQPSRRPRPSGASRGMSTSSCTRFERGEAGGDLAAPSARGPARAGRRGPCTRRTTRTSPAPAGATSRVRWPTQRRGDADAAERLHQRRRERAPLFVAVSDRLRSSSAGRGTGRSRGPRRHSCARAARAPRSRRRRGHFSVLLPSPSVRLARTLGGDEDERADEGKGRERHERHLPGQAEGPACRRRRW